MTILKDVLTELVGMFVGDAPLSAAILLVVALSAALIDLVDIEPLVGGGVLLAGCLGVLVCTVARAPHRQRAAKREVEST